MHRAYEVPQFTTTRRTAAELDADLIAVPIPHDHGGALPAGLDQATCDELASALQRGEFSGKPWETWTGPSTRLNGQPRRVVAIGIGPRADFTLETARRAGASAGITARAQRRTRLALALDGSWSPDRIEALVEGLTYANYDPGHYKSKDEARFFVGAVEIAAGTQADLAAAVERGARVGDAVNAARVLINEPGNRLTPATFVERGRTLLDVPGVATEILDEHRLADLGMGLLLGVGRGSAEPPRMLVAQYRPAGASDAPVLALVGKGVTFDTGGISIKPADNMERMKDDMAGGATVMAALRTIALERLPVNVIAVVPATENMPGGRALKPGDVIRGASGLTVEVNNTDAEGRLILGDALWHARQLGATHLIDVATLTGACVVALGMITTGLFGTDAWVDVIRQAAGRAGERVWPMPLFDDYRELLKSEIADMINSPGRAAGAITAAMFLKEFVGTTSWAHLDIAGTAWADEAKAWTPKGATGTMIRTLVEVARSHGRSW